MNDHPVYLRHPTSKRVLELFPSGATQDFIDHLRRIGYLPASADDYRAQQAARKMTVTRGTS